MLRQPGCDPHGCNQPTPPHLDIALRPRRQAPVAQGDPCSGLQHVLTMFGSTVAVPLLFAPALWPIPEAVWRDLADSLQASNGFTNTALLISSVMLCSGVATLLQSTFGSPPADDPGRVFLVYRGVLWDRCGDHGQRSRSTGSQPQASDSGPGPRVGRTVASQRRARRCGTSRGPIIGGGDDVEMVIGFSGLMGLVRKVLSPVVVGPVIMLIGLALYQAGAPVAATLLADRDFDDRADRAVRVCTLCAGERPRVSSRCSRCCWRSSPRCRVCACRGWTCRRRPACVGDRPHPARPDLSGV